MRCSAGVAIGSDSSGGVKNVTVRDCNFNGTQRGFYLKTVRGRGGVTEDIRFHNVTMTNIANEGILLDMKYNPSAQEKDLYNNPIKYEPFTDKTPILRNVEFIGIKGNVQRPVIISGLPESLIENIRFKDINLKSKFGIVSNYSTNVQMDDFSQKN